jgi:hypothetical protein
LYIILSIEAGTQQVYTPGGHIFAVGGALLAGSEPPRTP